MAAAIASDRGLHTTEAVVKAALQLRTRGWAVVPDVITPSECEEHIDRVWFWLESLGTGIRRDDPVTWSDKRWPPRFGRTGIINRLEVAHQDFVWKLRSDPRITSIFAALWGTDALLSSFDSINVMRPMSVTHPETHGAGSSGSNNKEAERKQWWHVDQAPHKADLQCIQGLLNITPVGPQSGTLEVREGSHAAHTHFWREASGMSAEEQAQVGDWYQFRPEEYGFWDRFKTVTLRGYGPGSLLLWDSRTVHQNRPPDDPDLWRHVVYACYQPAAMATEEDLRVKREAYEQYRITTHWPARNVLAGAPNTEQEERTYAFPHNRKRVENDTILRLAGVKPYDPAAERQSVPLLEASAEELEAMLADVQRRKTAEAQQQQQQQQQQCQAPAAAAEA